MKKELKIVNELLDLFEYKTEKEEICKHCNNKKEKRSWYCFKFDKIQDKNEGYTKLSDAMHEFNIGEDYIYQWTVSGLEAIKENLENGEKLEDMDLSENIDSEVNCYTSELTKWLNGNVHNIYYLDEAVREMGATENILSVAQYQAIYEVFNSVLNVTKDLAE